MPRKIKRKNKSKVIKTPAKKEARSIRWGESYTSLLLGLVVVILGTLFIASIFRSTHQTQLTSSISTVAENPTKAKENIYVVQTGDDLWHISEKFYGTGYNYLAIAKANNITNPSFVYKDDKLVIPDLNKEIDQNIIDQKNSSIEANSTPKPEQANEISGDSYVVQSGDDLWNIAVRAYADGYRWPDIAKANSLEDPGMIFSGNTLKIPRP